MPLHTKYRPKNISEFYGNLQVIEPLKAILKRKEDIPHSFLFTGSSGCGKTTLARIMANELEIPDSNLYVYNTSDDRGLDTMREIINIANTTSLFGGRKMIIMEEFHQTTSAAQEALLVTLEEPPKNTFFVLCTTEPEKLQRTLKRRCHEFQVKPLDRDIILQLLNDVLKKEDLNDVPKKYLKKIALNCEGSPGIALKQLDMVIDLLRINKEDIVNETIDSACSEVDNDAIRALGYIVCNILLDGKSRFLQLRKLIDPTPDDLKNDDEKTKLMRKALSNMSPESIRNSLCAYITNALWKHNEFVLEQILDEFIYSFPMPQKSMLKMQLYKSCQHNYHKKGAK